MLRDEDRERGNENSFCNRTLADDVNYTETDRERFLGFEELQGWRIRERGRRGSEREGEGLGCV